MFLQFVLCTLQFHVKVRREFPADPKIRRGKSCTVLALPDLKCSFQILTAYTTHFATHSYRSFCALNSTQLRLSGLSVLLSSSSQCG